MRLYNGVASLKNVNNFQDTNIYTYLETSDAEIYEQYLNVVIHFSTPELIRHLWQLKTVVFLYWCLMCYSIGKRGLPFSSNVGCIKKKTDTSSFNYFIKNNIQISE